MGLVEDMLAASSAKVLALYPTDEPVEVKTSALDCKMKSKGIKELVKKMKDKTSVVHKKRKIFDSETLAFEKKQRKDSDDSKHQKFKKEDMIDNTEYFEFKNNSEPTKMYTDIKKVELETEMKEYEVTEMKSESSHVIKDNKSYDIMKMIKENAEKYNVSIIEDVKQFYDDNKTPATKFIGSKVSKRTIKGNPGENKQSLKRRGIHTNRKFSPGEDEIIRRAIQSSGDKVNMVILAKQMSRTYCSVLTRIRKLKSGSSRHQNRPFTLAEDLVILDRAVGNLNGKTLQEFNLYENGVAKDIGSGLGRLAVSILTRWGHRLKPWILQYYSGTLNLNIRIMLANYLMENFDSIESIDWILVAERPEFAGHTQGSLRNIFSNFLFSITKLKLNLESTEMTLKHIADYANEAYRLKSDRKVPETLLTRQKEVVDYFEQYVEKQGITNFL